MPISISRAAAYFLVLYLGCVPSEASVVSQMVERFKQSDIEFQRGDSQVPFLPLSFLSATVYDDLQIDVRRNGESLYQTEVELDQYSQALLVPLLVDERNMVGIGEYLSHSQFATDINGFETFKVDSVGIPLGWLQQTTDDWQVIAFVMPWGNRSSNDLTDSSDDWSWQTLGGAFGRYVQTDDLWWAFGLYLDVGGSDNYYYPYIGFSWSLSPQLTISAILPWPEVLYSPNDNWLFRFGVAPGGVSWQLDADKGEIYADFNAWNLGLSAERRLFDNIWFGATIGSGRLRGLSFTNGEWDEMETSISSGGFASVYLNFRPSVE